MTAAAARYLPHFSGTGLSDVEPRGAFRPLGHSAPAAEVAIDQSETQRAVEKAVADAREVFERVSAADRATYERRLAERVREVEETAANVLAEKLAAGLRQINDAVGEHVGRVLARFLDGAVRERALDELGEAIAALLSDGGASRVTVAGPAALVQRLKAVTSAAHAPVETVVSGTADVTVTIDDTILGTRIDAWMDRVSAAVRGSDHV